MQINKWRRTTAVVSAVALLAAACGNGDGNGDGVVDPGDITTGVGVSSEPCPNSVLEDPAGCIYLGQLQDMTGPFAGVGVDWVAAQRDFWAIVNEAGGISGFEVDVDTHLVDTQYSEDAHVTGYEGMRDDILFLAASLGTDNTNAILPAMQEDDVIAFAATLWSGWEFIDSVVGINSSYCLNAVSHLDWAHGESEISTVQSVGLPGDYGGDVAAGAERWAEAAGAEWLGFVPGADAESLVPQIVGAGADVVVLGLPPQQTAQVVGGSLQAGFQGRFLGAIPTFHAALTQNEAAMGALAMAYTQVSPIPNWDADTPGHQEMRDHLGGEPPNSEYYTLGWLNGYAVQGLLQAAADAGDLTRAGILAALDGIEIDYKGMIDSFVYGGGDLARTAVINAADPEAPIGLTTLDPAGGGEIAATMEFDSACIEL